MIIVVDSGGTKADWRLIYADGTVVPVETRGYSPLLEQQVLLHDIIHHELPPFTEPVHQVFYYGTGIHNEAISQKLNLGLQSAFNCTEVFTSSDLLGACRATCGIHPGIVAILGTGAATCMFDGAYIKNKIPSLGYIVGDEGGGASIGKSILRHWFYNEMPVDLQEKFSERFKLTRDHFLEYTYRKPGANSYLASFTQYAVENESHPFVQHLLKVEFDNLIQHHLIKYKETIELPCHFVGSVSWLLQISLKSALKNAGLVSGKIIRKPIDELVKYHLKNL